MCSFTFPNISACPAQSRKHTGTEQVLIFAHGGVVEYCANQNATPGTVQNSLFEIYDYSNKRRNLD